MKIVVIGGSGFIGSKLVPKLREHGHEAIAASPNRCKHPHGRGTGRSSGRCFGGRRRIEPSLLGRFGGTKFLRNVDPQSPQVRRGPQA